MEFKTDIQIAQESVMTNISEIAEKAGIDEKYVEQYGKYKAKIDYNLLKERQNDPDGKLVLVTAISPTPAGAPPPRCSASSAMRTTLPQSWVANYCDIGIL